MPAEVFSGANIERTVIDKVALARIREADTFHCLVRKKRDRISMTVAVKCAIVRAYSCVEFRLGFAGEVLGCIVAIDYAFDVLIQLEEFEDAMRVLEAHQSAKKPISD